MLIVRRSGSNRSRGFSLIELAIGLVIVAVLLSSLLVPLVTQVDQRRTAETQRLLDEARSSLIGFVMANGRFPCPATATSFGAEAFSDGTSRPLPVGNATNGNCYDWVGFLPAATLGITPVDQQGFQTDPFGNDSNRVRYAVASSNVDVYTPWVNCATPVGSMTLLRTEVRPFTSSQGMTSTRATMPMIARTSSCLNTLLSICTTAACSGGGNVRLSNGEAIAVIYSVGKNALTTGAPGVAAADEAENLNGDSILVNRVRSETPGAEFDDMLVWISPSMLFGRLIAAGQQP